MSVKVLQIFSYGWDDAPWSDENGPSNVFPSNDAAQAEIDDLISTTELAVQEGYMDSPLTQDDFMIDPIED